MSLTTQRATLAKRLFLISAIGAAAAALTAVLFLFLSGLQYADQESKGLEPGYTPIWIARGIEIGLILLVVLAVASLITGAVWLVSRRGPKIPS